jgi:azurin
MKYFGKLLAAAAVILTLMPNAYGQDKSVYLEGHDDYQYSVKEIRVHPGEKVTITLKTISSMSKSEMAHNWVLLKMGVNATAFTNQGMTHKDNEYIDPKLEDQIIAHTKLLGNGEQDSITFTAPKTKGEYTYVCTFPGHYLLGMKGKFIVE